MFLIMFTRSIKGDSSFTGRMYDIYDKTRREGISQV